MIEHGGLGLTATFLLQLLAHPLAPVRNRRNVKLPAAPASTVTDWLVDGPLIAPPPLMDHA